MLSTTPTSEIVFQIENTDYFTVGDEGVKIKKQDGWKALLIDVDTVDSMIRKEKVAGNHNYLWLDAYADSGYYATIGFFRLATDGVPRLAILKGDNTLKGIWFYPRDGKIEILDDVNLYREAADTLRTDDLLKSARVEVTNTTGWMIKQETAAYQGIYMRSGGGLEIHASAEEIGFWFSNTRKFRVYDDGSVEVFNKLYPTTDDSYELGSDTYRWKYVHVYRGLRAHTRGYSPRETATKDDRKVIHAAGSTSDFIITLQDGTGRVQFYWNSTPSPSTFIVGGEHAGKILFSPSSNPFFVLYWADGSGASAGDSISWSTKFSVYQNGDMYFAGKLRNDLIPYSSENYDLGSDSYKWRDAYIGRNLTVGGWAKVGDHKYSPITVICPTQSIPSGGVVYGLRFVLPAGRVLKLWKVIGWTDANYGVSAEIYNNTDGRQLDAKALAGGIFDEGTPLESWSYDADKFISFYVHNSRTESYNAGAIWLITIE